MHVETQIVRAAIVGDVRRLRRSPVRQQPEDLDQPARRVSPSVHATATRANSSVVCASATPETTFAIAVDGEAVGSIGFVLHPDVERVSAEIGYWLAEPFWGRGITTEALIAVTQARHRHSRTHTDLCGAVRVERGRHAACSKRPVTCSRPAPLQRDQGRPADRSDSSTRSSPIRDGLEAHGGEPAMTQLHGLARSANEADVCGACTILRRHEAAYFAVAILARVAMGPLAAQPATPRSRQRRAFLPRRAYFPERFAWHHKQPEEVGMDPARIAEAVKVCRRSREPRAEGHDAVAGRVSSAQRAVRHTDWSGEGPRGPPAGSSHVTATSSPSGANRSAST